jgi:hypothetical protein
MVPYVERTAVFDTKCSEFWTDLDVDVRIKNVEKVTRNTLIQVLPLVDGY